MNQTYTVKPGDTLYGISHQFGVSVTDLAKLNNITGSTLQIGQVLKIPITEGTNPTSIISYTVKSGDSLYSIANKYNTTVDAIKSLNNLKNNNLAIGQVLTIPENGGTISNETAPSFINYTVTSGDTLYSISKKYNVPVDTIIKDNELQSNVLSIGRLLKIRVPAEVTEEVEECFGPSYTAPSQETYVTYTVKKGDNLYSIANKYSTTVDTIKKLNNLKNNNLSIGQVLKIPSQNNQIENTPTITYTVKSGDSLYSIAKKYNTTVDSIKKKNNLTSNMLSIGQKLII